MPRDKKIVTINQFFAGGVASSFDSVELFVAERMVTITEWHLQMEVFLDQIDAAVANNLAGWGVQRLKVGLSRPGLGQGDVQEFNFSNNQPSWANPWEMLGYGVFGFPIFLNAVELDVYTPMQHAHSKHYSGTNEMVLRVGDRLLFTFNTSNFLSGAPFAEVFCTFEIEYEY